MKLTVIAAVLLFVGGCHVTTGIDHPLVNNAEDIVSAGSCAPVEGPYPLPSGAINDYTITDNLGIDLMDVMIVDYGLYGCDFTAGYGIELAVTSVNTGTGEVPSGNYSLAVSCNNVSAPCDFFVDWSANY